MEAPQPSVERAAAETEGNRRAGLVAFRSPERLEDRLLLDLGQGLCHRLGALDGDPQVRPSRHSYVDSRAPWDELPDDGLPRYPDAPPPNA